MSNSSNDEKSKPKPKRATKKVAAESDEEVVVKVKTGKREESSDSVGITKASKMKKEEDEEDLPTEKKRDGPNYKQLWEKGVSIGLINDSIKTSKPSHRFIVYYKTLEEKIAEYEAASSDDKAEMSAAFEVYFDKQKEENDRRYKEKKSTAKKSTKKSKEKEKSTHKKGTQKKGTHKKGTQKKGTHKENSDVLKALWNKCMEKGLIDEDHSFYQDISNFITFSELNAIFSRFKSDKKTQKIFSSLNDDIKSFNEMTHPVSRYFKVYRTYEVLWKEAVTLKLISKEVEMKREYFDWINSKTLVAYMETVIHNKDLRQPLSEAIVAKLKKAGRHLKFVTKMQDVDLSELIASATKKGFINGETPCIVDKRCVKRIDAGDLKLAYFSYLKLPDEEAEKRKSRWANYMEYLASE